LPAAWLSSPHDEESFGIWRLNGVRCAFRSAAFLKRHTVAKEAPLHTPFHGCRKAGNSELIRRKIDHVSHLHGRLSE